MSAENSKPEQDEKGEGSKKTPGRPFPKGTSGNPGGVPKSVAEVRRQLAEHAPGALDRLVDLMDHSEDERVQAMCAKDVLDRVLGKPHQSVSVDDGSKMSLRQKLEALTPDELRTLAKGIASDLKVSNDADPEVQ